MTIEEGPTAPVPNHLEQNSTRSNLTFVELRERGYFLLPLPAKQKFPPPKGWVNAKTDHTIDPRGNVAIGTRGVAILITNDEKSTEWAKKTFGEPHVYSARGAHWYFRPFKGQKNEANRDTPVGQMEFHAENKYALVPPSIHPSGTAYRWGKELPLVKDLPLAPDLRELWHPSGTHHDELLKYSAALAHDGESEQEILAKLKEKRDTFPDSLGHPNSELEEMAASAFRKFHEKKDPPDREQTNENAEKGLNPGSWFDEDDEETFVPHFAALDYIRVYHAVITEYVGGKGTPSEFMGKFWVKDAEGIIKSRYERAGASLITPTDIRNALESLTNLTRVTDPEKIGLPLDQVMPLPDHVIPMDDGLFNLLTRVLQPHSPDFFYTEYLPRKYEPKAKPEVFFRLLDALFSGDPNGELKKTQIFETIAWTLMRNYDIQGTVIFYGQGGEGKSVLHAVIADLLLHTSSLTLEELEKDKFKRAELYGSWANLISESTTEIITSEWFKRLTDGTVITVDRKNGQPFKMASHAKMIIDTNELPVKENELRAFYRRVIAIIDFPNMLEDILDPPEISEIVQKLKDPEELNKIFSHVVDNYYAPLVQRMKFTGQLSIADAEKAWTERSNPALSFITMLNEDGRILTDPEDVKALVTSLNKSIDSYIVNDGTEEHAVMPKQEVITEAVKWATEKGFPAKTIDARSLGHALQSNDIPNMTVSKKLGKGVIVKAWRDVFIDLSGLTPSSTVTDGNGSDGDVPLPQKVRSEIGGEATGNGRGQKRISSGSGNGNGSLFLSSRERARAHMHEGKDNASLPSQNSFSGSSVTEVNFSLGNTEKKTVTDDSKRSVTDPLPIRYRPKAKRVKNRNPTLQSPMPRTKIPHPNPWTIPFSMSTGS